jgi:hypothetical protein
MIKNKTVNKSIYAMCAIAVIGWVAFRFAAIGDEQARYVFNATRDAAEHGAPIEVMDVKKQAGVLKEPLEIKNNRAVVSASRLGKFAPGQKVGSGKIISVSNRIDLDTGMYVIRTSGVKDGLNYAENANTGFFVPVYAVTNGTVMIVENGVAKSREVKIAAQDSDIAYVTRGLSDGDTVILSKVSDGERVKEVR